MPEQRSIPFDELSPGEVAKIDQNVSMAGHMLDHLIDAYREHQRDCPHGLRCPGEPYLDIMYSCTESGWAMLLNVAVDRLAKGGTDG